MDALRHSLRNGVLILTFPEKVSLDVIQRLNEERNRIVGQERFVAAVCDLSEVKILDSSGISLFLTLRNSLEKSGRKLFLYRPSRQTINLLALVRLRDLFPVLEDEKALEALLERSGNQASQADPDS